PRASWLAHGVSARPAHRAPREPRAGGLVRAVRDGGVPDGWSSAACARERGDALARGRGARSRRGARPPRRSADRAAPIAPARGHEAMSEAAELPNGLDQALAAVAGELGMATASWLFVRAVARCMGDEGVASLADRAGGAFTVLDAIGRGWLEGAREARVDPGPALDAVGNVTRLVVVGVEAMLLDALVARLDPAVKIAMIAHSPFSVDWGRVLDNYGGRIERVDLDT